MEIKICKYLKIDSDSSSFMGNTEYVTRFRAGFVVRDKMYRFLCELVQSPDFASYIQSDGRARGFGKGIMIQRGDVSRGDVDYQEFGNTTGKPYTCQYSDLARLIAEYVKEGNSAICLGFESAQKQDAPEFKVVPYILSADFSGRRIKVTTDDDKLAAILRFLPGVVTQTRDGYVCTDTRNFFIHPVSFLLGLTVAPFKLLSTKEN